MVKQTLTSLSLSAALCVTLATQGAIAQGSNDFFGGTQGDPNKNNVPGAQAAEQALANSGSGDYTSDEKRMQKKYKLNMKLAQGLIDKGDQMMKEGEKRKNDKSLKKGKILKEIGEKRLAQLKENNPVPDTKM
ncbi:MAG: hypothetical protein K2W95_12800 [Candidatus Obscuribacterales bacterium]|nr:hypothetical protein [Candidatus Obscuribacterales bacterium]